MQVPIRKKETYRKPLPDPYLSEAKFNELKEKLIKLKEAHPRLAKEVKRLAEMGDFSENAGYQLAKGRLRGLNQRILELEAHLKTALVFKPSGRAEVVALGRTVTIITSDKTKTYTILGGSETNPTAGIISHSSPLGSALLGKRVGEIASLEIKGQKKEMKIIKIA